MGTNYYWREREPCPTCGREYEDVHIGKSSAGWCFALHVYPDQGINDLPDWLGRLDKGRIVDEYGREVSEEALAQIITCRTCGPLGHVPTGYTNWKHFHSCNGSEVGPHNLLRSRIDGRRCIGHGMGTWDLFEGEFS